MEPNSATVKTLNNGVSMPMLGLGVFKLKGEQARATVRTALEYGYRMIDTARAYSNEESVGLGIIDSGIPRDQIFVTTKLWKTDWAHPRAGLLASLKRLKLKYVDLLLLHWPFLGFIEAYKEIEKLQNDGLCRAIGISNFKEHHITALLRSGVQNPPQVHQIEIHPMNTEDDLLHFCQGHSIVPEAYSPLGGAGRTVLDDPRLIGICRYYHRTPAQIVLRWHLQRGTVVIPKSAHPERILENSKIFDFELKSGDMAIISSMDSGDRRNYDPDKIDARPPYLEPQITD